MRFLVQLQLLAFVAALAHAAAMPSPGGLAARHAEPAVGHIVAPKKRLLGICLFGLSILGDCDGPKAPAPSAVPPPNVAPSSSSGGNATAILSSGAGLGQSSSPASITPAPAPSTSQGVGIDLNITSAPGSAGLNSTITQAAFDPYTYVYPQPPLPARSYNTPDSIFTVDGGTFISPFPTTRRYNLVIDKAKGAPDGFLRMMFVINGQYPAPKIEANQGDTLEITVTNNLDIPQALHWHGMRQKGTGYADGVPGIHQCPISPGQTFTYKFKVEVEAGTYWYHSHYGNTMGDGLSGALIIHKRNMPMQQLRDYDSDRIVYLSDWNDNQSMVILKALHNMSETYRGTPFMGPPDALLINGVGQTDCAKAQKGVPCTQTRMPIIKGGQNDRLRLRLINHGSEALIRYSIDNHMLTVIEIDDTPVKPVTQSEVMLWPGQRVSVIIRLNQGRSGSQFYMRARMAQKCFITEEVRETKAILQYTGLFGWNWFGTRPAVDSPWGDLKSSRDELCHDMDEYRTYEPSIIEPSPSANGVSVFNSAFGIFIDYTGASFIGFGMNDVTYVNYINNPLLKQIKNGAQLNPLHVASHTWPAAGAYDLILNQHDTDPIAHPFHLHGRPFHILARGKGAISAADLQNIPLNTANPLRRDTLSIPGSSYAVLRVITDDPGVWPIHCHIGWHVGVGKLGVLVVRPDDIRKDNYPPQWDGLCAGKDPNEIDYVRRSSLGMNPSTGLGADDDSDIVHEIAKRLPYHQKRQAVNSNGTHWWVGNTPYHGRLPLGLAL
ncbi:hypothetical protein CcaverHIS002_0502310 [Cutaneotrichosporon cavernicola]|uniref:Multicopper oxidase n=1 Tax=Cutaneotrichosporon cavernicola TaxID=279322 RepID=A0AA48L606_9TREE|nr:uncharacterized protein CcaverHIS019_0502890 [Cutaneotrichosporon cavernicola]BEI84830.1 hypothetical protein CcaverHIS002_0502310 [Cutaneotrichosporon cavernicola]BEI92661.1 hypothetical protein CcaverHIS019_0502890 [Cutaneotrichosporon cavernicola]BEJ00436.1 hypothetical protein CcaverHIS631_0502930 [Cutaneotrichosporon cavernicola]BEJ08205.1 hypothetical protein CcaverHIS641_0502900 [Cutaneotrichosporon cavernicola]